MDKRIIGKYKGSEDGPLLIVIGGMHGNEPAGIMAIDLMSKMLEVEPITNPSFNFRGMFLGLIGNVRAYEKDQRYIEKDMNRQWFPHKVEEIMNTPIEELKYEDLEMREFMEIITSTIQENNFQKVVLLDLHTTSSYGGIFSIPTDDPESLRIALELHAPVVKGMLDGIKGTTMHYFNTENLGVETIAVSFESGQHNEDLSVNRAIAAITNCMRSIGCVEAQHVENRHDTILIEYSRDLPKLSELVSRHNIEKGDHFNMLDGYKNFQKVSQGEVIAHDKKGNIEAPEDALVLMPLYQPQGEDGFFLIKEVEGY